MSKAAKDALAAMLNQELLAYSQHSRALPGIEEAASRRVLIRQLIDSIRRIEYVFRISERDISEIRRDSNSEAFDPLKAAVLYKREGNIEEAIWLVFLAIHFGKSKKSGWRLVKDVYGCFGAGEDWTWERVSNEVDSFVAWVPEYHRLASTCKMKRYFGNHRRYESLDPNSDAGLDKVVSSYVDWVNAFGSHSQLLESVGEDPGEMFGNLYNCMKVTRFGRLAKFDFLTMLAKLEVVDIDPGSAYLGGATGPLRGARLLFQGNLDTQLNRKILDGYIIDLEQAISAGRIGIQAMEDALCNWQKSPSAYQLFRG